MKQKPFMQRMADIMEGKGFYIVLFLCVTAIGISGYYLCSSFFQPLSLSQETLHPMEGQSETLSLPEQRPTPTPPVAIAPSAPAEESASPATTAETPSEAETSEPPKDTGTVAKATVFTWPVRGTVSRGFSLEVFAYDATMGDWRVHDGMDIEASLGTEVMSVSTGTVKCVSEDALMGTMVTIDHGDGLESIYANLNAQPTVNQGDGVGVGTVIGAIGNSAIAESNSPSHLHFELRKDGKAVDPTAYLPEQG